MSDEHLEWAQANEDAGRWGTPEKQSFANELEERLLDLAVRVIKLTAAMPRTTAGLHIANQILRSATSPAPNYAEARGAESRADFAHKLGVVSKELNETCIWLRMIIRSELLPESKIGNLLGECEQLSRILSKSRSTVRAKAK